jgi:hypothetical protein
MAKINLLEEAVFLLPIIQTMRPPIPPQVKKAWIELNPHFNPNPNIQ